MVLPISACYNQQGHLEVGGCDVVELASEYGTPLFIMDEKTIRTRIRAYMQSMKALEPESEVIYVSKAFICVAMCQLTAP